MDREKMMFALTRCHPLHPKLNLSRSIPPSNAEIIFACIQKDLYIDPNVTDEIIPVDFCDNI